MRRFDKKKHMAKANKSFQERANKQPNPMQEEVVEYTYIPDIYPNLSKMLK